MSNPSNTAFSYNSNRYHDNTIDRPTTTIAPRNPIYKPLQALTQSIPFPTKETVTLFFSRITPILNYPTDIPLLKHYKPKYPPLFIIDAKLNRPSISLQHRWGLSVILKENTILLVVSVDETAPVRFIGTQQYPVDGKILPGDVILSLNGFPISSFGSFQNVTNYMKHSIECEIVLVRKNDGSAPLPHCRTDKAHPEISFRDVRDAIRNVVLPYFIFPRMQQQVGNVPPLPPPPGYRQYHLPVSGSAPSPYPLTQAHLSSSNRHYRIQQKVVASIADTSSITTFPRNDVYREIIRKPCDSRVLRNDFFMDKPYYSDNGCTEQDEGRRAALFIDPLMGSNFRQWLKLRKSTWRKNRKHKIEQQPFPFWVNTNQPTFQHWLVSSTNRWRQSYSWNKRKRIKLEKETEELVHFPNSSHEDAEKQLVTWLRVRRNQWRILWRKRQRRLQNQACTLQEDTGLNLPATPPSNTSTLKRKLNHSSLPNFITPSPKILRHTAPSNLTYISTIDALLEEEERRNHDLLSRPPLDISFIFDANLGAPDDVIAHTFRFLPLSEHGKLLCISWSTSYLIQERHEMWRQLCPTHWVLPSRPRKPWHLLYITKSREEQEATQKRADDVLTRANKLLLKSDALCQMKQLIARAMKSRGFSVNIVSGVILERNSILNLAVMNGRLKVAKWLLEEMGADIESTDVGDFSPLLNAAFNGDKCMVRYLLSKGADRAQMGKSHYSCPLAREGFEGLNAEGWARKKGFGDVADLILLGYK